MGTKPAKVGHLGLGRWRHLKTKMSAKVECVKCVPCQVAAIHKKVFTLKKGLRSTGGPDVLKWGLPGGGSKSAKVAPTPYV